MVVDRRRSCIHRRPHLSPGSSTSRGTPAGSCSSSSTCRPRTPDSDWHYSSRSPSQRPSPPVAAPAWAPAPRTPPYRADRRWWWWWWWLPSRLLLPHQFVTTKVMNIYNQYTVQSIDAYICKDRYIYRHWGWKWRVTERRAKRAMLRLIVDRSAMA